jgi:hypothetical protein
MRTLGVLVIGSLSRLPDIVYCMWPVRILVIASTEVIYISGNSSNRKLICKLTKLCLFQGFEARHGSRYSEWRNESFAGHQFRASGDFNRWSAVMTHDWPVYGWLRSSYWWMGFLLSSLLPLLHYCSCRVGVWRKQVNLWLACMHVLEDTGSSPSLLVFSIVVTLPFKIGSGDTLATWV